MVGVSASVNLPLHCKIQKFSSGTGSPGWFQKKGCKTAVVVVVSDNSLLGLCRTTSSQPAQTIPPGRGEAHEAERAPNGSEMKHSVRFFTAQRYASTVHTEP